MNSKSANPNNVKPKDYWVEKARDHNRLLLFYGRDVLDVTQFSKDHPGGNKVLHEYNLKDVKQIFFSVFPHPLDALSKLKKFQCGKVEIGEIQTCNKNQRGIFKKGPQQSSCQNLNKKLEEVKKVGFTIKEIEDQKEKPNKQSCKKRKKLADKTQQNLLNLEENKTELLVPYFNSKFIFEESYKENR